MSEADKILYQHQPPQDFLQSIYLLILILSRLFGNLVLDPQPIFHPSFGNKKINQQHTSLHQPLWYHIFLAKL